MQVVGDTHGTVLHLGERDCSVQRRHQKVLEEAPGAATSTSSRARGCARRRVDLAAHVGYVGAGTVEFLLDDDTGDFYFLEMNTRLQVEHPVTERSPVSTSSSSSCGSPRGEPLPLTQDDVHLDGHAIEARVYAEDAVRRLPAPGRRPPPTWSGRSGGARRRTRCEAGQVVSTAYDPMLGKVIAHGADREEARQR